MRYQSVGQILGLVQRGLGWLKSDVPEVPPSHRLVDHVLILGWREGEERELLALVERGILATQIVVVVPSAARRVFLPWLSERRLRDVLLIEGDTADESVIDEFLPQAAREILVLGDGSPPHAGAFLEGDINAIKAAIHLARIGVGSKVRVKIGDNRLRPYLEQAGINHIQIPTAS